MTFPFVNDRPGHYRSPDIGESVQELAGSALDPSNLEFELSIAGYKNVEVHERAAQEHGRGGSELHGGTRGRGGRGLSRAGHRRRRAGRPLRPGADDRGPVGRHSRSSRSRLLFMGVAAFAIIAGAAARTSGRRRSTAR